VDGTFPLEAGIRQSKGADIHDMPQDDAQGRNIAG